MNEASGRLLCQTMKSSPSMNMAGHSVVYMRYVGVIIALLGSLCLALAVDGLITNLSYPSNQLLKQISPQLTSLHLNQPSVFNGNLILGGNAVHEVWDIANPYAPFFKARMTSPYAGG